MGSIMIEILPKMVNLLFPYEFYHAREDVLRNRLELVDQFDHHFTIPLKFARKIVVMWEVVSQLKRYYDFEKVMYLHLKYEGGIRFSFEIKDEDGIPLTPSLVHPTGTSSVFEQDIVNINSENPSKNPRGIVNRTGPQNTLVGRIGMRRVKQTLPHNAAAGRRVMSFQNQYGRVTVVAGRRVLSFEKVITKSQSKGRQTLPIPRKFVQEFIRRDWSELILKVRRVQHYNCKLVRRNGREKDCHLGKPWYKLVSDLRLKKGDKVVFETIIKGLNTVNVTIIRKGE
ncbi:DNA-binding barrel domain superfamily [Sesbania bispinosa]|nr:DNA-binding barrel domain superfamily [Sesbania bispinosa]